jgi:hypothetical protein
MWGETASRSVNSVQTAGVICKTPLSLCNIHIGIEHNTLSPEVKEELPAREAAKMGIDKRALMK